MDDTDVVYLGEKHDNSHHHRLQLEVIEALLASGKRPAIGFEVFSVGQTGFLQDYSESMLSSVTNKTDAALESDLRKQLGWTKERDRDWNLYAPLLRLARDKALAVFGLDLPVGVRRRLSRKGLGGLTRLERRLLYPSGFENDAYRQLMYDKLSAAHCGWSDERVLKSLYETWIARNDSMAMAITEMIREGLGRPIVVILGAGHVQHDMGVYERVARLHGAVRQLNVGFREIALQPSDISAYLDRPQANGVRFGPAHHYLWFTPRVDYENPCDRFGHSLRRHPGMKQP